MISECDELVRLKDIVLTTMLEVPHYNFPWKSADPNYKWNKAVSSLSDWHSR